MKLLLINVFLRLSQILPLRLLHAFGNIVGTILYVLPTDSKRTTLRNLQLCFPELSAHEQKKLTLASLRETAKMGFELGKIWLTPVADVLTMVMKVTNGDLVEAALQRGKGLIIVAPHLGNWEVYGLKITSYGPTTYLYKPQKSPEFDATMKEFRSRGGANVVPTDRYGVTKLVKALQRGEIIGILPDQEPRTGGVFAPFFTTDALTMTLVSKIAAKTGAAVICGFAKRLAHRQGFEVIFESADPDIACDNALLAATALNRAVERCVRVAPAQYQWEYKRFKKRPPGEEKEEIYR